MYKLIYSDNSHYSEASQFIAARFLAVHLAILNYYTVDSSRAMCAGMLVACTTWQGANLAQVFAQLARIGATQSCPSQAQMPS